MRFADEIIVMKDGQFICKGDANNCINAQLVNQVYGVNCELYSHNNKQYIEVI